MQTFSVPDMSCNHCKVTIEKALEALPDAAPVFVDLDAKEVVTEGKAPVEAVLAALSQAGYPATVIAGK